MADLLGSTRGTCNASPEVARKFQAGDLQGVGGSPEMGRGPDLQSEVLHAKGPEAQWRGGRDYQEARLKLLPAEDRAHLHRTVPALDQGSPHYRVLVVSVPLPNERPPF